MCKYTTITLIRKCHLLNAIHLVTADILYDVGTGLEIISPFCPHLFLEVAGTANLAKGKSHSGATNKTWLRVVWVNGYVEFIDYNYI